MSAAATWSAPSANCRLILAYNAAAPLAEEPPEPCGPGSLLC